MSSDYSVEREIPISSVTEESVDELVEDNAIDEDEVSEYDLYIRRIQANPTVEANNTSVREIIKTYLQKIPRNPIKSVSTFYQNFTTESDLSSYGVVENVFPEDEEVRLDIYYAGELIDILRFSYDSQEYANLLAYHNITDKPGVNLEGKKIIKEAKKNKYSLSRFIIPRNVSTLGKIRYSVLGHITQVYRITNKAVVENITKKDSANLAVIFSLTLILGVFLDIVLSNLASISTTLRLAIYSIPVGIFVLGVVGVISYGFKELLYKLQKLLQM